MGFSSSSSAKPSKSQNHRQAEWADGWGAGKACARMVLCGFVQADVFEATMALLERIQKDLTEAMRTKDPLRLSVLRMVKSALRNKEVEKIRPLEEAESLQVLQTLVKQRRESVEQFTRGGRTDLAAKESQEIAIIEGYLPRAPSEAELDEAIEAAIAEVGATTPKEMGSVIKAVKAKLAGKTLDGKFLADRVRDRLGGK